MSNLIEDVRYRDLVIFIVRDRDKALEIPSPFVFELDSCVELIDDVQVGITHKNQNNILGVGANAWMQPPVLVAVLFGGVRGVHPVCVPHMICC